MTLNNETAKKVSALFKTPHTNVIYCGVHYKNTVCFSLENNDEHGATRSGFVAHITQDFQVYKVERLKQSWGLHNGQMVSEHLPVHPAGNKTLLYTLLEQERSQGKRVTVKDNR